MICYGARCIFLELSGHFHEAEFAADCFASTKQPSVRVAVLASQGALKRKSVVWSDILQLESSKLDP